MMKFTSYQGLALLLGLFFTLSTSAQKPKEKAIKIGIVDTGFCTSEQVYDATNSVQMKCPATQSKNFRYHGQWVLKKLKNQLKKPVLFYPTIVFDQQREQKEVYWKKALNYLHKQKVDIILLASSLPFAHSSPKLKLNNNTVYFVASGQRGLGINGQTKLWPQSLPQAPNVLIIGAFLEEDNTPLIHPRLMYANKVSYYFSGEKEKGSYLKSSSLAVTTALIKALQVCSLNKLTQCLQNQAKKITLWPKKKSFLTY